MRAGAERNGELRLPVNVQAAGAQGGGAVSERDGAGGDVARSCLCSLHGNEFCGA